MERLTRKRGRPANKTETEQNSVAQRWAKSLRDDTTPITASGLVTLFGPPTDEGWNDQDEDYIERKWATSTEKKAQGKIKIQSHGHMLTWWKACLRALRSSPVEFISPLNNLWYSTIYDDDTGRHLYG